MDKTLREARRSLRTLDVKILTSENLKGHYYFTLQLPDQTTRRLTFASSPRDLTHSIERLHRNVRAFLPPTKA